MKEALLNKEIKERGRRKIKDGRMRKTGGEREKSNRERGLD